MRARLRVPRLGRINGLLPNGVFLRRKQTVELWSQAASYTTFATPNLTIRHDKEEPQTYNTAPVADFRENVRMYGNLIHDTPSKRSQNSADIPRGLNELFSELLMLLKQNRFNQVIEELKTRGSELTYHQFCNIMHLLLQFEKYRHMLAIFEIFKEDIIQSLELIEMVLSAAYKQRDFDLFDDLFKTYIEQFPSQKLNPDVFNIALKVYLGVNPGLAKQFLYQMFQSDYPINEKTLYEYLKVAEKTSSFQSVKLVIDMLERYPLTPINDLAYGELYSAYVKNGTEYQVRTMQKFLEQRQVLGIETVKVAKFLHEIAIAELDYYEVMSRLKMFKMQHSISLENLERMYHQLYKKIYTKMNINDAVEFIESMKEDGLQVSDSDIYQKVIYFLKDDNELIQYLKSIKGRVSPLDQFIVKAIWTRCVNNNTDHGLKTTRLFLRLAEKYKGANSWIDTLPDLLLLRSKKHKLYSISNKYEKETFGQLEQVQNLLDTNHYEQIVQMLTELLRLEVKPSIRVINKMIQGLCRAHSEHVDQIYNLAHEIYRNPPMTTEITYLEKDVLNIRKLMKDRGSHVSSKSERQLMIDNFTSNYQDRLDFTHYVHLASYLNDLMCPETALKYLLIAESKVPADRPQYMMSVYTMILKVFARMHDPSEFNEMFRLVEERDDLMIYGGFLTQCRDYKRTLMRRMEDPAQRKEFDKNFSEIYDKLKTKYGRQRARTLRNVKEIVKLLEEWIEKDATRIA